MSKKAILHVGCPKTGTTSIQGFCVANQGKLAAEGILYPYLKYKWPQKARRRNAHGLYANAMRRGGTPLDYSKPELEDAYLKDLTAVVEPAETVLFSDETLWQMACRHSNALHEFKQLLDDLGFTEYRVIVYLRRQDLYAESIWNQNTKGKISYKREFESFIEGYYCKYALDYKRGITRYESIFGAENITVRIYDRAQLKDGDSVADFMDAIGFSDLSSFKPLEAEFNDSIKGQTFLKLKRLCAQTPKYVEGGKDFLRKPIALLSQVTPDANPGPVMEPRQRARFLKKYAADNRYIAQRYFGRNELFGPQKVDGQQAWKPAQDELAQDVFLVLVDQLTDQRARERKANARIAALEAEVARLKESLERIDRNPPGSKVEKPGSLEDEAPETAQES